ncbi:uncharacterized lipoprotein YddW (UPF0748 family) [Elusimicrobium simillimum]|uniref:glycoside hydrolase family 10 protein n=1 Tax=Elusimicrobium simillimum TaxID=3143438 RepID=UPI003C6F87C4
MKKYLILILMLLSFIPANAKLVHNAAWVTLLTNIDWPTKTGLSVEAQKAEFIKILDTLQATGISTVVLQVRPCADRIWESKLPDAEPWSRYLTGTQGKHPGYDPLKFAIDEAHKRGMELHASFNPFRVGTDKKAPLADGHPAKKAGWSVIYGDQIFYDPAIDAVRAHSVKVINEVIQNYNIDAVHLDDYFYPYPVNDPATKKVLPFNDKYGGKRDAATDNLRRSHMTSFVKSLKAAIDTQNAKKTTGKPRIQFGISPFAIWKNGTDHPTGKNTFASYDGMFADTKLWIESGLLDYVTPQIYWHHAHKAVDFPAVLKWWENLIKAHNAKGGKKVSLYIGLAGFRHGTETWGGSKQEIGTQIDRCKNSPTVDGCMIYSTKQLMDTTNTLRQEVRTRFKPLK